MRKRLRTWLSVAAVTAIAVAPVAIISTTATQAAVHPTQAAAHLAGSAGYGQHHAINCAQSSAMCVEVANSKQWFGHYVGHDEPSMLFSSDKPGSGNQMQYNLVLPKDPPIGNPNAPNKSFYFELAGASWLGMAMCDSQSFPEQVSTCPPDSDSNILDPAVSPKHVGEAYMEMQFYPPGWIQWPTWQVAVGASSCNPTMWCAAMNIDSLSINPVTNKQLNPTCQAKVGLEYVNFAFITKNGVSTGPANPLNATTSGTYTPSPADLFMNSGDHLQVAFKDTPNGLNVVIHDLSTGQSGSMTASKANGFAQIKFAPTGTSCTAIPYNFHPMYSSSSLKTRVTWAAGSYNVAFDTEIGHFQFCRGPNSIPATEFGITKSGNVTVCPKGNTEGRGVNATPSDGEDAFCFPAKEAPLYKVTGCTYTNAGFDGASYQRLWPNGNTAAHPAPFQFTSPTFGPGYTQAYSQAGFETDLPATEGTCNPATGHGCTLIPQADNGLPAAFYPFYTTTNIGGHCYWQFGSDIPGETNDFGQNAQYGTLLQQDYTNPGGSTGVFYEDFRNVINNPC